MINKSIMACIGVAMASTASLAADLPSRRAPPVYVPPPIAAGYSWTGIEFGLTTSYTFAGNQFASNIPFGGAVVQPTPVSMNKSGFDNVGGGIGANYQFTPGSGVVVGGMVDADYFNLHNYKDIQTPPFGKANYQERLGYLATANGRLGYGFDRILVYATGGLAFGDLHTSTTFPSYTGTTNNSTKTGYDFGGGAEYAIPASSILNYLSVEKLLGIDKKLGLDAFDPTIRAEFIHYRLGSQTVLANGIGGVPGGYLTSFKAEGNVVRVGLGYKFGGTPTPVVARY